MYRRKLLLMTCAICICLFCFSGCDTTPAERVATVKEAVNRADEVNRIMDTSIAGAEEVIADTQAALQDPNISVDTRADLEKVLAEASAKLTKFKAKKQEAMAIITRWQEFLAEVDPNNLTPDQEFQLYAEGAKGAAQFLPQPYRTYVLLGLALTPLIGSVLKNVNQWRQLQDDKRKTTELVISVDELLKSTVVTDPETAKEILKSKQSSATRKLITDIHDPMKNTAPTK